MKCVNCAYFNLPGTVVCGRCQASLGDGNPAGDLEDVLPPRARDRTARQTIDAHLSPYTRRGLQRAIVAANSDLRITPPTIPINYQRLPNLFTLLLALVPGLPFLARRQWYEGIIGLSLFVTICLFVIANFRTQFFESLVCLVGLGIAASIFMETWRGRGETVEDMFLIQVLEVALFSLAIPSIGAFLGVWWLSNTYQLIQIPDQQRFAISIMQPVQTLVVRPRETRQPLRRGELVGQDLTDTENGWGVAFGQDEGVPDAWNFPYAGVVLAEPGDTVSACGKTLCVNRTPVKKIEFQPEDLQQFATSQTVPQGKALIARLAGAQVVNFGNMVFQPPFATKIVTLVDRTRLNNQVVAVAYPAHLRGRLNTRSIVQ